ncbi:MAG: heme ABC transporter ATP-binding protein [Thermoplasmata archaeon]
MRLSIDDLSYSFGEKRVLNGVSFEVGEGEFLGLMGPNGSGKTTLLRCLMNYLPAQVDAVKVDGRPISSLSPSELAKTFAVVPQSSATDFTFTAYDIVMMGRMPHVSSRLAGMTRRDAAVVAEAMRRTNTWQLASRPFFTLSGGERQRVIVARAIAQQPKALLLDEPTVYLDINGQFEIMDLIKGLNRDEGLSIISVLHDVNLAARYCDRIVMLNRGRVEAIGTPKEVLTPEIIESVYRVEVVVRKDPFSDAVYVLPRSSASPSRRHGTRVHVLCGGGTGGPVMKALLDHGYSVSAGVINVLDSDSENAADLRIPTVSEVPFAPISDEAHGQNLQMISDSSAVVVSPFPVGPGNIRNLEAAKEAVAAGKCVLILSPDPGKEIDFVGGRADEIVRGLISSGAIPVKDIGQLLDELAGRRNG